MRLLRSIRWTMIGALVLLSACQSRKIEPVEPGEPVSFSQDIQPIFTEFCAPCHIDRRTSGVRLLTYQRVTSSVGAQYEEEIVTPGDAEGSPIIDKLEPSPQFGVRMPRGRPPLSNEQIALIRAWIDEGAPND